MRVACRWSKQAAMVPFKLGLLSLRTNYLNATNRPTWWSAQLYNKARFQGPKKGDQVWITA